MIEDREILRDFICMLRDEAGKCKQCNAIEKRCKKSWELYKRIVRMVKQ